MDFYVINATLYGGYKPLAPYYRVAYIIIYNLPVNHVILIRYSFNMSGNGLYKKQYKKRTTRNSSSSPFSSFKISNNKITSTFEMVGNPPIVKPIMKNRSSKSRSMYVGDGITSGTTSAPSDVAIPVPSNVTTTATPTQVQGSICTERFRRIAMRFDRKPVPRTPMPSIYDRAAIGLYDRASLNVNKPTVTLTIGPLSVAGLVNDEYYLDRREEVQPVIEKQLVPEKQAVPEIQAAEKQAVPEMQVVETQKIPEEDDEDYDVDILNDFNSLGTSSHLSNMSDSLSDNLSEIIVEETGMVYNYLDIPGVCFDEPNDLDVISFGADVGTDAVTDVGTDMGTCDDMDNATQIRLSDSSAESGISTQSDAELGNSIESDIFYDEHSGCYRSMIEIYIEQEQAVQFIRDGYYKSYQEISSTEEVSRADIATIPQGWFVPEDILCI